jgi:hypothetical protein
MSRPNSPTSQRPIHAQIVGDDQCHAEDITAHGPSPVLALCRELVAAKVDPDRSLHAYRGDMLCLVVRSIGEAAHLDVNGKGTGFKKYRLAVGTASPVRPDVPGHRICPATSHGGRNA